MCVKLSHNGRSVNLLHIDHSGGAYDISYDAWNYLYVGQSATQDPQYGGGIDATYTALPISECANLITSPDKKLPLAAANSMNYVTSCLAQPDSWVATNYGLWNIATSACTYGIDEQCVLNLTVSNQPTCLHQLGLEIPLTTLPVFDIEYGTGKEILAVWIRVGRLRQEMSVPFGIGNWRSVEVVLSKQYYCDNILQDGYTKNQELQCRR